MKRKKSATRKRPAKAAAGRKEVHRSRPLHKRILLHPFSVMVLLCAGVLILGSTFHGAADSYSVTAEVHAAPPTSSALITSLVDQQHLSGRPIAVDGTCPPSTYVKLYRSASFSGEHVRARSLERSQGSKLWAVQG